MEEIWKDVAGYEGLYQVSNLGRVRSLDVSYVCSDGHIFRRKGCIRDLGRSVNNSGYQCITLHKRGKSKMVTIHKLVATAFIPNPNKLKEINHKDENKLNNRVENLEWCTHKYNQNYNNMIERGAQKQRRSFVQMDMDGNVIKVWHGLKKLQRETEFCRTNVAKCCKGLQESHKGYKWKYLDESLKQKTQEEC